MLLAGVSCFVFFFKPVSLAFRETFRNVYGGRPFKKIYLVQGEPSNTIISLLPMILGISPYIFINQII